MPTQTTSFSLDSSALTAFSASLAALPIEEARKAKRLYLRNALSDARAQLASLRSMLIVFGIMSIIPVFLLIAIPAFLQYRIMRRNLRERLTNALDIWGDDIGADRNLLAREVAAL